MAFILPRLDFDYDAMEPYIDEDTMRIHHLDHHAAYLNKFNEAIKYTDLEKMKPSEIFAEISIYPAAVRNNGGGFFNHSLFWKILTPDSKEDLEVGLADAIAKYFGTLQEFKQEFSEIASNKFGSGWVWLVRRDNGELLITSTSNQDNPLMDINPIQGIPILCLDIWEHAYYLKYRHNRSGFIEAFWNIVNWKKVAELYNNSILLHHPPD
ncbi:MAG: superoxide dismutase [Bacteroidales bacterium]|jgi:Fe-Mn family superoxide dismutase|nr:superoxide dismutase [Bacteroidales bacterium]